VVEVLINRSEKAPVLKKGDCLVIKTAIGMMMRAKHPYFEMVDGEELESVLSANSTGATLSDFDTEALENELISRGVSVGKVSDIVEDDETQMPDDGVSGDGVVEPVVSDEETDAEAQAKADAEAPLREATKENVMELSFKEVKEACKKYKITIGKKKQDELIALLLPYLN